MQAWHQHHKQLSFRVTNASIVDIIPWYPKFNKYADSFITK
jgi:hypothetical protein